MTPRWTERAVAPGVVRIAPGSRLDGPLGVSLATRIAELIDRGSPDVIVDLGEVTWLDPGAMRPVVSAARRLGAGRISVVLDPLLGVFQIDGADAFFDVAVTCEDAIARLAS